MIPVGNIKCEPLNELCILQLDKDEAQPADNGYSLVPLLRGEAPRHGLEVDVLRAVRRAC